MNKLKYFIGLCALVVIVIITINLTVNLKSKKYIYSNVNDVPYCYTGIVLGAQVSSTGYLSDFLQDRVDAAIELYNAKKINRFLLTGDHGRVGYDEVNSMKDYLMNHGIKEEDIFLDHAGFDTYNSLTRAKEIFQVKDAIIITQEFHLPRAVYIARGKGLNAYGVIADKREYSSINYLKRREILANIKAYFELLINKNPKFLGNKIPITGDSKLSYD